MSLINSLNGFDGAQELLIKLVEQSPNDWPTRKRVGQVLFDAGFHSEASELVWAAPEVPPVTEDVVFTTRVVAMGHPRRAVRLVSTMIEANKDSPEENLNIAKALMQEGLVLQALRFYGAATSLDLKLIDEEFELMLMTADSSDESWREITEGDDFPWEGPRDSTVVDLLGDDEDASATELLLSSVTQRVPLKAPVKSTAATTEKAPVTTNTEPQHANATLSPAAQAIVKQQAEKSKPQEVKATEEKSETSLVNFFEHKEKAEQKQEVKTPEKPVAEVAKAPAQVEQPAAKVEQPEVKATETPAKTEQPVAKAAEPSTKVEGPFSVKSEVTKLKVEEPNTKPKAKLITDPPVAAANVVKAPEPSNVQAGAKKVLPDLKPVTAEAKKPEVKATLSEIEPASRPESGHEQKQVNDVIARAASAADAAVEAKKPELPKLKEQEVNEPEEKTEDLSDEVANVLAERKDSSTEEKGSGFMSSIKAMFKRPSKSKPKPTPFGQANVLKPITTTVVAKPLNGEAQLDATSKAQAAQASLVQAVTPTSSPVTTTVAPKQETASHAPPKELDGRTQLVALAPQDGSVFFDELSKKYEALNPGELPEVAVIARDMANVDYLGLVNEACNKDLNAFSKLLGLHTIMTASDCSEWVADMDLLRKGYGDAVLATVVSKYSVSECREILGAVYQRPRSQAAV